MKKNKFFVILKKEIKDLITVQTIFPILMVFVLFYFMGDIMGMMMNDDHGSVQIEQPELAEDYDGFGNDGVIYSQNSIIGFIDNDDSDLSKYIKDRLMYLDHNQHNGIIPIVPKSSDPEEAMKELSDFVYAEGGVNWTTQTLVVIPKGFEENLLAGRYTAVDVYSTIDSFSLTSMISGASSQTAIAAINGLLSQELFRLYQDGIFSKTKFP